MKIIVAPDKFKGSLDSFALCDAISEGIRMADASTEITQLPLADGGDGFAKVLAHYVHTATVMCNTVDALGRPIQGTFEWSTENQTAVIELATASGLARLKNEDRNPMLTSTYGTGLIIKEAIKNGARKIIIGIGGSATNDGGAGLLSALGYSFLNSNGEAIEPRGENLINIDRIVSPQNRDDVELIIASDVDNPLLGHDGAANGYAAQKGATREQVIELEKGMENFSKVLESFGDKPIGNTPGAGAAGGAGAGLLLLPNVTLQKGVDIILESSHIRDHLPGTSWLITGEGAFDKQTLHGKVVHAVTSLSIASGVPAIAICGKIDADYDIIRQSGLAYITSIVNGPMSFEESNKNAGQLVKNKVAEITHLILHQGIKRFY